MKTIKSTEKELRLKHLHSMVGSFPPLPERFRGMDIEEIIRIAKEEYFEEKYKNFNSK
jgi:hypothetical protein